MQGSVVVVGGSAGGIASAVAVKRHYPDADVVLVRREEQVLVPCGIPYIFGTVGAPENNLIPDGILTQNGVQLIVDEVTALDFSEKVATTAGGRKLKFDKLILATGSQPLVPPIPGTDLKNVFVVKKDVAYLKEIQERLKEAKEVVIIGGGFIGLEMADEFRKTGCKVTVVEMLPHCLYQVFDEELCRKVEEELTKVGVEIRTSTKVQAIEGDQKVEHVLLENGDRLPADMVILAVGVRPSVALAQEAGLKIGDRGGVLVDRYMRTSQKDVFAVGDCAEKFDFLTGMPSPLRLASIATAEGRIAGANVFQLRRENRGTIGVFSTKVADLAVGVAGYSEQRAKSEGLDFVVGRAETVNRHPGGMPGVAPLKVTLIFKRRTGALIGGQVCCGESVGELVNVIAAMIQYGAKADEIAVFQMGTHPALTASPLAYPLVNAAELALKQF